MAEIRSVVNTYSRYFTFYIKLFFTCLEKSYCFLTKWDYRGCRRHQRHHNEQVDSSNLCSFVKIIMINKMFKNHTIKNRCDANFEVGLQKYCTSSLQHSINFLFAELFNITLAILLLYWQNLIYKLNFSFIFKEYTVQKRGNTCEFTEWVLE